MANTGFISVAPQIAALAAQVGVVDTVVDAIRATDFPTTDALINAAGAILTDIHDTDLPAVEVIAAANAVILADIHDTDLPAVAAQIAALNNRGTFTRVAYTGAPGHVNWLDTVNETNPGKLVYVSTQFTATDGEVRITLDGIASNDLACVHTTVHFMKVSNTAASFQIAVQAHDHNIYLGLEFKTSLQIEAKQSNGANNIRVLAVYQKD